VPGFLLLFAQNDAAGLSLPTAPDDIHGVAKSSILRVSAASASWNSGDNMPGSGSGSAATERHTEFDSPQRTTR